MGNRAVITTKYNFENNGIGIYLHWNGGYDSVSAFLKYCELKGYYSPDADCYGFARLCQVIGNYFGGSLSVGVNTIDKLDCDNWDNGVYIIEGWKIVDRKYFTGEEQMNYELQEMLLDIDESMPEKEQITEYLQAEEIKVEDVQINDIVFVRTYDNDIKKCRVIGYGKDKFVNGTNVKNVPYVDYCAGFDPENNINNYLRCKTVRKENL